MKFKVGDRVRVKKDLKVNETYGGWNFGPEMKKYRNKIITIKHINYDGSYLAKENNWGWTDEMLEKVRYTYEDLKKASIGTKVTFEEGVVLIKIKENFYTNNFWNRSNEDLKDLCGGRYLGKIVKIEEPTYQTVYGTKVEILDETEKRYLKNIIRPFRDKVECITKRNNGIDNFICIHINGRENVGIILPHFDKGTMYKGMEDNKEYTLEELGL